jgi:hypothetical protein
MSTGSVLYLVMVLAMFGILSAVLAYQSWQQSRQGPEMLPARQDQDQEEPHHAIAG